MDRSRETGRETPRDRCAERERDRYIHIQVERETDMWNMLEEDTVHC